ncbi:lamin tail domain-containing protein [Psychroserpens jangbogonensis]|uniref:lamin tail domain-containing protein n=1 Tax=Psychroserpens jangbogonensis TaxID=1484460 RepID=UPI00053EC18E|nr:lamin tail domain-containing protein [Psychroserpens jangbogonensis]
MKINYALIVITFLCAILSSHGQTKIDELTFETAGGYTTSVSEFTDGFEDYFVRTDGTTNIDGSQMVFINQQGTYFFAVHDTNGDGGPSNLTLNFNNIDITNYSSLQLRIHIAEDDEGGNQDWDGNSYMHITGSVDSAASQNILWIEATGGGTNTEPRLDTNFNGSGNSTVLTDTFTQFTANISGTGADLDLQIEFNGLNDGDEDIAIDNIEIWGVFITPTPTITASTTNVTNLDYALGAGPAVDNFDITGDLLDVASTTTITSNSTNFEVSLTAVGGYGSAVNVPAGTLNGTTTIFTRLISGLLVNPYSTTLNITNGTTGLSSTPTINVSGEVTAPVADVVITEIMYNTPGSDDYEWIEICNLNGTAQDVSNYVIDVNGTPRFTFPSSTSILANSCITIILGHLVTSPAPECIFPPDYSNPIGNTNVLPNTQATITLESPTSIPIDSVFYDDFDNADTDGLGSSFHVVDATLDNSDTVANWQGVINGGSPRINTLTPSCLFPDINVEGNVGTFPDIAGNGSNIPVGFNNTLFIATAIGSVTPQTKSYRIQNTGAEVLNINSITLSGANLGDFTVSNIPATVAVSSFETFDVTFNPSGTGDRTAVVSIDSDDPDSYEDPYEFNIKGTGVCSSLTISVSSFAPLDGPVGTEVTITGNGFSAASIVSIGGLPATVISATATELVVKIPNITNSGPFTITEGSCFTISLDFILTSNNSNCGLTELIMSEVYDQDGFSLGYIEVYNGTGNTIDLSSYYIRRYGNAQDLADDFYTDYYFPTSQASIDDGEVIFGRISTDANIVTPDFDFTTVIGFAGINGDDILHLYNATTLIDVYIVPNNIVGYTATRSVTTSGPSTTPTDWTHTNSETTGNLGDFNYVQVIDRPTIVGPVDFTECGDSAEFEVQASPNDGSNALTYQWYYNEGNDTDLDWEVVTGAAFPLLSLISGINTDTLTLTGPFESYDGYQFYCLVTEDGACGIASSAAKLNIPTTTWTVSNTWDNGTPDIYTIAILNNSYDTVTYGSFSACRLTIASGTLNIRNNNYVEVNYDLIVNGILDIETEGSLVMVDDAGTVTNNGTTNVHKTTTEMETYDYTYWSSPVDYSVSATAAQTVLTGFHTNRIYSFDTSQFSDLNADSFDDDQNSWTQHYSSMSSGIGYAAMSDGSGSHFRSITFNGRLNTGIIPVTVALSQNAADTTDDWNLLGNPYPSAIYADEFIVHNINLSGTVYLWTHEDDISISNPGPDAYNFNSNDYAMYNLVGGVGTGVGSASTGTIVSSIPTGYIASGQGFFIDAITAGTVEFTNAMRNRNHINSDFFRNSESNSSTQSTSSTDTEKDRMWINMTNSDGAFSQILIGYMEDGTLGKDRLYDGIRLEGSNYIDFYSKDATNLYKYGIQGRPPFTIEDVIPLGYDSGILGGLTISLYETEGILNDVTVYLRDNLLNTVHSLTNSDYTFTTEDGNFSDRFEIIFQTEDALSIGENEISPNELSIIELQSGSVKFSVGNNLTINTIEIIDLLGRTLYSLQGNNSTETFELNNLSQTAYIAKVTLSNGQTITKRAIKRN